MAESFWNAVRDERYRKEKGIDQKERRKDEQQERSRDERMRKEWGEDCPSQYGGR